MNLLQSLLATVQQQRDTGKSSFKVSSIWVTDRCLVLDTAAPVLAASKEAAALTKEIKARFPDVTILEATDATSTVISITY